MCIVVELHFHAIIYNLSVTVWIVSRMKLEQASVKIIFALYTRVEKGCCLFIWGKCKRWCFYCIEMAFFENFIFLNIIILSLLQLSEAKIGELLRKVYCLKNVFCHKKYTIKSNRNMKRKSLFHYYILAYFKTIQLEEIVWQQSQTTIIFTLSRFLIRFSCLSIIWQ